jgi:hypothetical protein
MSAVELVPRQDGTILSYMKRAFFDGDGNPVVGWSLETYECYRVEVCSDESGSLHIEFYRKGEDAPFEFWIEAPGCWHSVRLSAV